MAYLSNSSVGSDLTIRLEQRKSYTFNVQIVDARGRKLDATGCSFRFVMERSTYPVEIVLEKTPATMELEQGFLTFNFQARDLNLPEGEYPYVLVALSPDGYSVVIAKGAVQLMHNPDVRSVDSVYTETRAVQGIEAVLRGQDLVRITVGNVLPPGMNFFSDEERETLNRLNEEIRLMKQQLGIT